MDKNYNAIAIIPARGGSKRIPGKNKKSFCGKPILAYSIEAALNSGVFDEVMVSTDDDEIVEIARAYGANVPFMRSPETSGDYATTVDVLREVLLGYEESGKEYDYICCLYPTAPFVTAEKLREASETLIRSGEDALVPLVEFSYPPQRGFVIKDGTATMKWPENLNARSQDLEPIYHDCGQFYFAKTDAFRREGKMFCDNTIAMIMRDLEVQDIDTATDWEIAELKYKLLKKRGLV